MRHASLFSGIGGFDLAAEWMGWENTLQCEIDPFCQKVLQHHFPSTHLHDDIKTLNGKKWKGKIDILTGGFPCQPFSVAGERRGEGDDRFLWPEMLRLIREIQPSWVVAENVRGLVTIEEGLVFDRVCSELEADGYEVQSFCIPACSSEASHQRDRLWIVAHSARGELRAVRDPMQEERPCPSDELSRVPSGLPWIHNATSLCRSDDGLPRELDGITVHKWRRESLRAYGNAIVPQVAYRIFQAISFSSPL